MYQTSMNVNLKSNIFFEVVLLYDQLLIAIPQDMNSYTKNYRRFSLLATDCSKAVVLV